MSVAGLSTFGCEDERFVGLCLSFQIGGEV